MTPPCIIGSRYRLEREGTHCRILSRTIAGWESCGTFDYDADMWELMAELVLNPERLVMDLGPCDVAELARLERVCAEVVEVRQ